MRREVGHIDFPMHAADMIECKILKNFAICCCSLVVRGSLNHSR